MTPSNRTAKTRGGIIRKPAGTAPDVVRSSTSMPSEPDPAIELLTVTEAAQLLKISVTGVRRLQGRRVLSFIKVGGQIRFARGDLRAYLETRRVRSLGP